MFLEKKAGRCEIKQSILFLEKEWLVAAKSTEKFKKKEWLLAVKLTEVFLKKMAGRCKTNRSFF